MILEDPQTGERSKAVIEPVTQDDFKALKKDKTRFGSFNWNSHKDEEVYKLRLVMDQTILGLMCLTDFPPEQAMYALEIKLLEVSAENRGMKKRFEGIAGCLIAFACRESFKRGYEGWVFLVPKTYLIQHYTSKYGFIHVPIKTLDRPDGFMGLNTIGSVKLIRNYLDQH